MLFVCAALPYMLSRCLLGAILSQDVLEYLRDEANRFNGVGSRTSFLEHYQKALLQRQTKQTNRQTLGGQTAGQPTARRHRSNAKQIAANQRHKQASKHTVDAQPASQLQ